MADINVSELSYADAVAQLEDIMRKMQSPDCDIDSLSEYTSRALALLRHCRNRLTKTDEEVRKCLEELSES